jgi:trigger factor
MKANLEKVSALGRKLNITIPATVVASTFDKMLKGIQKQAAIKGFRQGKAPISTIKSIYGDRVKQDVVQELVQKHYFAAIQEQKIDPISYPEFEFDQPDESKDFNFTANFDVKPEVTLKKYDNVDVEREKFEVGEHKVNEVLENIRTARAVLVDVLEDRPAAKGDTAIIDFDGYVDGKALEGGKGFDHNLELGSNSFIEGFEEGIAGMKIGQEKTLTLKFPTPYHAKELEGKPVEFKVKLKALKKKELPVMDDAFVAQMMGAGDIGGQPDGTKTLAGLKETILKDLQETEQKRIDNDFKNRLLRRLVELNPVDVPASMLTEQKAALVEDMKKKMLDQGLTDEQFVDYTQKWDKDFEKTAADMIQSGFIIDTIAKTHDLKCTDQDLEAKFVEYSKQTGIDLARIKEFYGKPEQTSRLTYMITEEKVIAYLMKTVKIKEMTADQLKQGQN